MGRPRVVHHKRGAPAPREGAAEPPRYMRVAPLPYEVAHKDGMAV